MNAAADTCPRCGSMFHCGVNDVVPCPCTRIALDATALAQLRDGYRGCLCESCLLEVQRKGAPSARCSAAPSAAPSS